MSHCQDCGTKLDNGICMNCHEELYICTFQDEYLETPSPEFVAKAESQKPAAAQNRKSEKREEQAPSWSPDTSETVDLEKLWGI